MSKAHRSVRPKGYMPSWSPNDRSMEIISQVKQILRNTRLGSASVRFIFYRLVATGYPKTERDYKNLAELLVKARRAQMIPFHAIVDSGTETAGHIAGHTSRASFLDSERDLADSFTLHEEIDQPHHVELWSEDGGSVPLLGSIVQDYPVVVYSTGGFSSVTVTHQVAQRVLRRDRPTIFLHVGDYDPSGESIYKSMAQDIGAFVQHTQGGPWSPDTGETILHEDDDGPDFRPVRVALTADQAIEWDLDTAPPKASDTRSVNWDDGGVGGTVQVQAMTEQQMEDVVVAAVEQYVDVSALEALRSRSEVLREEMRPLIESAFDDIISQLDDEEEI